MIEAWRLVKKNRASEAFSGEGARRYGGRWNRRGKSAVYVADSLSLAALELFVHLGASHHEMEFAVFRVRIPERPAIMKITTGDLPSNWREQPAPETSKDLGSAWLAEAKALALQTPSVIVPRQFNFLLNPAHPSYERIQFERMEDFSFDPRMWK